MPSRINVDAIEKKETNELESQLEIKADKESKIVGEIVEKREANIKYFEKEDHSYEAAVYPVPVHYFDNGQWKEIDNTLEEDSDDSFINDDEANSTASIDSAKQEEKGSLTKNKVGSKNILKNKQNAFQVSFSKYGRDDNFVKIKKDKYEISWGLEKAKKSSPEVTTVNETKLKEEIKKEAEEKIKNDKSLSKLSNEEKSKAKEVINVNENKKANTKATSSIQYKQVLENIDLRYDLMGDNLKENIILNKPTQNPKLDFKLSFKNLIPKVQKDKSIIFYDEKDKSKAVFLIQIPYMYDASGAESKDIDVAINQSKKDYILTIKPNSEWLNSKDRVYPVTIDPPITSSLDSKKIIETFVCSNDKDDKCNNELLRVGKVSSVGYTRSYIRFDGLPKLDTGDMIISANMYLLKNPTESGQFGQINVHKVIQSWPKADGILWGNKPAYDPNVISYAVQNNDDWYRWDVTSVAKEWYATGVNNGLMLKYNDENAGNTAFWSSDQGDDFVYRRPSMVFNYINNSGLEDYWTYHSQDVGRAGTGYINDYNGNLIYMHDDINMNGNKMPVSIKHIFNSNDKDIDMGFGNGWRLNISQKVVSKPIDGVVYYEYVDADGTRKYFKNDSSPMKEEYGEELTLTKNGDSTCTISDKKNNKLNFDTSGKLVSIKDSNNNSMTIIYESGLPKYVNDGVGRQVTLNYINGHLNEISDPSGRKLSYGYTGSTLTSITYPDSKQANIQYDTANNIKKAINIDGYSISYGYTTTAPNRVISATEQGADGAYGQELNLTYGYNTTSFKDAKGRINILQFDNSGKTVSIKDSAGKAQYYKYEDSNNKKDMTLESKLQSTVTNLLYNSSAEYDRAYSASPQTYGDSCTYSTEYSYIGNRSLKISTTTNSSEEYFRQNVNLDKGKQYTFSAYVKTMGLSSLKKEGACIGVYYKNKDGNYVSSYSKYLNGTNEWTRLDATFTLPADATSNQVMISVDVYQEVGTVFFDCLQLEEGPTASRYNLIENSDLESAAQIPSYWSGERLEASDISVTNNDSNHPADLGRKVFKLGGRSDKTSDIFQSIDIKGKKGDTFVVSGWGKGSSVPNGNFAIRAKFKSGTSSQDEEIKFNGDSNDWQYASGVISAKNDYTQLSIYLVYDKNANEGAFDGIQLYKEEFGTSYQYDDKGNLLTTAKLAEQKSKFEYDGNNNLIKATDPKGSLFQYDYDGSHNIKTATTAENVVYSFTYDNSGNPKTAKIGDSTLFTQSEASYTSNENYINTVKDSAGNTVTYGYNETKGTLDTVTDAKQNATSYTYDSNLDRLKGVVKNADGREIKNSYDYKDDKISAITHNGFTYNFNYDSLGNNTRVDVGSQTLISNSYEPRTSRLLGSTYGNGNKVSLGYDDLDRVIQRATGNIKFNYQYDNNGNLAYEEKINGTTNESSYKYIYDLANRLTETRDNEGNTINYEYDLNNNIKKVLTQYYGTSYTTIYDYDKDNRNKTTTTSTGSTLVNTYDALGRVTNKSINSTAYNTSYNYKPGKNGSTTNTIESINNNGNKIDYTYDANGNIETINQDNKVIKYYYNELNEVKREDNPILNKTIEYTYDNGGNIRTKSEYEYNNGTTSGTGNTFTGSNLCDDGSFEAGKNDVGAKNTTGVAAIVAPLFQPNKNPNSGIRCFYVDGNAGDNYAYLSQTIPVTPGKIYNISFYHEEAASDKFTSDSSYMKLSDGTHISFGTTLVNDQSWRKKEKIWVCPSGITSIQLRFGFVSTAYSWMAVDDINIAELQGKDILKDGGFEYGDNYPVGKYGNGNALIATNNFMPNQNPRTGSNCFYLYGNSGDNYAYTNRIVPVQPGKLYYLSFYHEEATGGSFASDSSYIKLSNGAHVSLDNSLYNDQSWRKTEKLWVCPEGITSIQFRFGFSTNAFSWMAVDDVSVLELNTAYPGDFESNINYIGQKAVSGTGNALIAGAGFQPNQKPTSGQGCFYIYGDSGDNYAYLNPIIPVVPGKKYNISYYHDEATAGTFTSDSSYMWLNNGSYVPLNSGLVNDQSWRKKELEWTCPQGVSYIQLRFGFRANNFGWMAVDDVQVVEKTIYSPAKTITYDYNDKNWGDKLSAYDGKAITYDPIGNPLTYDGNTFSWQAGRQLAGIALNTGKSVNFKYNDNGIRTEKNYNGIVTKYYLDGDKVNLESNGTDIIYYSYNANGNLVSMRLNGTEYFYVRNAQGDIIGLIDKAGTQVVSYAYDTWGKLISITGSLKDTVGVKNPYRYRGYRYDTETGLYYLQSRYYNPEWGRFINADGITGQTGELLSHNMFAYCKNNPVNMSDDGGYMANYICNDGGEMGITSADILDNFDNGLGTPTMSAISSGVDSKISPKVANTLTKSKSSMLDTVLTPGCIKYIKNPGVIPKAGAALSKTFGVLSLATLGLAVTNNFVNYKHPLGRTLADLGCFGLGFGAGLYLAALLNPVTLGGGAVLIIGGLGISAITSALDNSIKSDPYYQERK